MSNHRQLNAWQYMVTDNYDSSDKIVTDKPLLKMTGDLASASVLSQIIYWNRISSKTGEERCRIERKGKKWIAKTREQWCEECGTTDRKLRTTLDKLKQLNLIEVDYFLFAGKRTTHIHLHKEELAKQRWNVLGYEYDKGRILRKNVEPEGEQQKEESGNEPEEEVNSKNLNQFTGIDAKAESEESASSEANLSKCQHLQPVKMSALTTCQNVSTHYREYLQRLPESSSLKREPEFYLAPSFLTNKHNDDNDNAVKKNMLPLEFKDTYPTWDDRPDLINRPGFISKWFCFLQVSDHPPTHVKIIKYCNFLKNMPAKDAAVRLSSDLAKKRQLNITYNILSRTLKNITGVPIEGVNEKKILYFKVGKSIYEFWKNNTSGMANAPGTSRYYFPKAEDLVKKYAEYIEDHYKNWEGMSVHVIATDKKIWRDFINHVKKTYNWVNIFENIK